MAWFIAGCVVFLPILYALYNSKGYRSAVLLTLAVWILYPIVWYLDEQKKISRTTTGITYSVMDVIAKIGLVTLLNV
jgi:bacteriorhodopsin